MSESGSLHRHQPAVGVNTVPIATDAKNRAVRTFFQGLGIDVAVAVSLLLGVALLDLHWTKEYWITLAATLGRTVVQTAVAYVLRLVKKPVGATQ